MCDVSNVALLSHSLSILTLRSSAGAAPGGDTMVIDPYRIGNFFSQAEIAVGAAPEWKSLFPY